MNEYHSSIINECIGDKIIEPTKECTIRPVTLNTNTYRVGDVIYYNFSPTSIYYCSSSFICECIGYHYTELLFGKKVIHCSEGPVSPYNFYNHITKEIFVECPQELNYKKINELTYDSHSFTRCSDSCELSEWNLAYINPTDNSITHYCVNDCKDTEHHSPSSDYKYEYIDSNDIKHCVKDCPIGTYKIQEASVKYKCVTQDQCDYYARDTYMCYFNCDEHGARKYHNFGSRECIEKCTGDYLYVGDGKTCYRKEDCNFIDEYSNPNEKLCVPQCTGDYLYYNYDSKFCLPRCGTSRKYNAEYQYVCYPSCLDIPDGDYKFESINDGTCYTRNPGCNYYYKKVDGIFKCATQSDCNNLFYYYYFGSECKANCDGYYQLVISQTQIKCYESLTSALSDSTVKYCDISQKKCWTNFPNNDVYYIKQKIQYRYPPTSI